jgi:hypothetical protein
MILWEIIAIGLHLIKGNTQQKFRIFRRSFSTQFLGHQINWHLYRFDLGSTRCCHVVTTNSKKLKSYTWKGEGGF